MYIKVETGNSRLVVKNEKTIDRIMVQYIHLLSKKIYLTRNLQGAGET
jgi:hypothetical protein